MRFSNLKYHPKRAALSICLICLFGLGIDMYVERYRISDYRWIYEFGKHLSFVMIYGSLFWSLLHPLATWSYTKPKWKKHIIWMVVGLIPILFFFTSILILEIKFGHKGDY